MSKLNKFLAVLISTGLFISGGPITAPAPVFQIHSTLAPQSRITSPVNTQKIRNAIEKLKLLTRDHQIDAVIRDLKQMLPNEEIQKIIHKLQILKQKDRLPVVIQELTRLLKDEEKKVAVQRLNQLLAEYEQAKQRKDQAKKAQLVTEIKKAYGRLLRSFNDEEKGEMEVSDSQLDRAVDYMGGKVATSDFREPFRPSRSEDVELLKDVKSDLRANYKKIALRSLLKGEGCVAILAAGAGLRMNPKDAPPDVIEMAKETLTETEPRKESDSLVKSKAAMPAGRHQGRPITYLGVFLTNFARLQSQISKLFGGVPVHNTVLIATGDEYRGELNSELAVHGNYGIPTQDIILNQETMGHQAYANEKHVLGLIQSEQEKAVSTLKEDRKKKREPPPSEEEINAKKREIEQKYRRALDKAREIKAKLEEAKTKSGKKDFRELDRDEKEFVIMENEKTPLGHGEFLHQMVSSGLLLHLIDHKVKWISVRNIDNIAAKFDEEWLVSLGMFLDKRNPAPRDIQPEVSARFQDQKGGGVYVLLSGAKILNEDPAVAASLVKFHKEQQQEGFELVTSDERIKEYIFSLRLSDRRRVKISSYPMKFDGEKEVPLAEIERLLSKGELIAYIKNGDWYFYELTTHLSAFWLNNAVALFSPEYIISFYKKEKQSDEEFLEELRHATPKELLEIADRGRGKFPVIIDPKPAKKPENEGLVAAKMETNQWQGTAQLEDGVHMQPVGVVGVTNIMDEFPKSNDDHRKTLIRLLRFLSTKNWSNKVEGYEFNRLYVPYILAYILDGDLIGSLSEQDREEVLRFISKFQHAESPNDKLVNELVRKVSQVLQDFIQEKNHQKVPDPPKDSQIVATAI